MSNDIEAERKLFAEDFRKRLAPTYDRAADIYVTTVLCKPEFEAWCRRAALAAPTQDQVMVDIGPPATQRDRWMYEQGRLAERDPRSHPDLTQAQRSLVPDHVWKLVEEVWCDLDRTACPAAYMQAASESIIKRFKAPAAPALSDEATMRVVVDALKFYADGHHFALADADAWDTVSGEPQNFQCDEAGTATVEDGTLAKMALAELSGENKNYSAMLAAGDSDA